MKHSNYLRILRERLHFGLKSHSLDVKNPVTFVQAFRADRMYSIGWNLASLEFSVAIDFFLLIIDTIFNYTIQMVNVST